MLGSTATIPHDAKLFRLLLIMDGLLLVGAVGAPAWPPVIAQVSRWAAFLLGISATAYVLVKTPSRDPFIRLGRVFTLWIPVAACALLFAVWTWRQS